MRNHTVEYVLGVITVSMDGIFTALSYVIGKGKLDISSYDFSYEVTTIQDTNNNNGSWS